MFDITMQRPGTLDELWSVLETCGEDYKILAGGTDLVVEARMGKNLRTTWVDVSGIPDLPEIAERDGHLWVGATTTWQALYRSELARKHMPGFAPAAFDFGSPQIRNLGTLGGNVAHASPSGDSIPVFLIYDAVVVLLSKGGEREMPVEEFITGVRKTLLEPGEIVKGFKIPFSESHEARFLKLGTRESLSISKVNCAARARVVDGKLVDVRLAFGAVAPTVRRARAAEAVLEGQWPDAALLEKAGEAAQEISVPITDWRSNKEYRHAMVKVLTKRAISEIMEAAPQAV